MHISLYQALEGIKIPDEKSAEVVAAVEEFMAMKMSDATKGLEAQTRGIEAQVAALKAEISSIKWLLGFIGTILAIIGLAPFLAKL